MYGRGEGKEGGVERETRRETDGCDGSLKLAIHRYEKVCSGWFRHAPRGMNGKDNVQSRGSSC